MTSYRAQYYSERMLQEHDMLDFKPSEVAASAVLLALRAQTPPASWVRWRKSFVANFLSHVHPSVLKSIGIYLRLC